MKFREEVLSKIFTYITVILLLGIVIFEAWSLQGERSELKQSQKDVALVQQNLDTMISMNAKLQEENKELQIFQNTWRPYAAFVESSEVLTLKTDLFVRPDLIPQEAKKAAEAFFRTAQEKEGVTDTDDAAEDEEENKKLEFQFDNPDGEDIFFPLSLDSVNPQSCLIYTVAFEKTEDIPIELVYEITFENGNDVERDENGEVEWSCIAYNAGDGWNGIKGENDDHD